MSEWSLEIEDEGPERRLRWRGRPAEAGALAEACREAAAALAGARRFLLEIEEAEAGERAEATGPAREVEALVEAAEELRGVRARLDGPLGVKAAGTLAGPGLVLALSADLLVAEEGMAGQALFWEDSRLYLPGELAALGDRLGRGRALEHALDGGRLQAAELGALQGEEGRRAWQAFRAGSRTAQTAAARLLRCRSGSRAGAEALERAAFALCFAEADRAEGVAAFRERREPDFPSNRTENRSRGTE